MTVYVDALIDYGINKDVWKWGASCHLFADTVEELHDFAARIGMRRPWFQDKDLPHYDLTTRRRRAAVALGAIELNRQEFVKHVRRWQEVKKAEAMKLLNRSYALRPCAHCESLARQTWKSDTRCPECHTSPKARIRAQAQPSSSDT